MKKNENIITLYPSNWIYNAGVIGFMKSLDIIEQKDLNNCFSNTGEINIKLPLFSNLNILERYFSENKISSLVGNNRLYKNYLQASQKKTFSLFVKKLDQLKRIGNCDICKNGYNLESNDIKELNDFDPAKAKFINRIKNFSMVQNSELGPSEGEFPNGFWNMKQSIQICHLCNFMLIHHDLVMSRLSDNTEIFINAPSFKVMYKLNKLVKETYASNDKEEARGKREILATTVIEYSRKIKSTLGIWTGMNLEIVIKSRNGIDFFSLPFDIIKIISDRNISAILSDLGEFKILNKILDRRFSDLIEIGYKLLRESSKDFDKRNDKLVKSILYRWENQRNLTHSANKILKLYSLIEEKQKGVKNYEYTN
jgi:CRISPR-associated protein Cst1